MVAARNLSQSLILPPAIHSPLKASILHTCWGTVCDARERCTLFDSVVTCKGDWLQSHVVLNIRQKSANRRPGKFVRKIWKDLVALHGETIALDVAQRLKSGNSGFACTSSLGSYIRARGLLIRFLHWGDVIITDDFVEVKPIVELNRA